MPSKSELESLGTPLESPRMPTLVKIGQWYAYRHNRTMPAKATPEDYRNWHWQGVRAIAKYSAIIALSLTTVVLPLRCAMNRAKEECKDYTMLDFGETSEQAFSHTEDILVTPKGYKINELYNVFDEGGTIHTCVYDTIQKLDSVAADFRTASGDYDTTAATTTLPS